MAGYWRQGQTGGRLALVLIAGTLPGVIAGSVIRVELLPGARVVDLVSTSAAVVSAVAAVLAATPPFAEYLSDPWVRAMALGTGLRMG